MTDLQLAAELGKTLLERNQELECNLRQYATYVEEQNQEIEFLTRQLSAMKDVNESRLKLYEQLETSIAEFDKTNIKLQQESIADKKKIKSLNNTVNLLEKRCEDLEMLVEELKNTREYGETIQEIIKHNDCDILVKTKDVFKNKENEYEEEICKLKASLSKAKSNMAREQRQREELELELSFLLQDNTTLQKQLECYKEKLLYLDGKCSRQDEYECIQINRSLHHHHQSSINDLMYMQSDVEDDSLTKEDLTLFHLNNGVVAYGKQDSILPVSNLINDSQYEMRNATSLLNELDAQYRVLIDKYEYMVQSRVKKDDSKNINYEDSSTKDSFVSNSNDTKDSSDWDSGISEISDQSLSSQVSVQTDISNKSIEGNFKHGPPAYKKLFAEIFSVLKRSLPNDGEEESKDAVAKESVVPNSTSEQMQINSKEDFSATEKKKSERSDKVNTAKKTNDAPVLSRIQPSSVTSQRKFVSKKSCNEIVKNIKNSAFAEIRAKFENSNSNIPVKKNYYKTYADVLKGRHRVVPQIQ
ncbi:cerebellar degeneration-related protein 2-like isoform X2 [Centruroides sculpturatus]|uniref:cerebellar degeneration-related protein 2-like isoform X2 n=1 Tax=Centruroides sculpturatus TaxID=218467 RepID=UPI000C6D82E0|nr:cerebellar degeneration-related protein 2-like isoform X2 [Centruroides sculpturatus]